jgi:hypothetical protein
MEAVKGLHLREGWAGQVVGGRPTASAAPGTGKGLLPMGKAIDAAFHDIADRLCGPFGSLPDLLASPLPSAASSGEVQLPSNEEEVDFVRMGAGALDPVNLTLLQTSPPGPLGARCPAPCCQYLPLQGARRRPACAMFVHLVRPKMRS